MAPECDWIFFWHNWQIFGLNLLGMNVGQPASPENTSWLDMEVVNKTGRT